MTTDQKSGITHGHFKIQVRGQEIECYVMCQESMLHLTSQWEIDGIDFDVRIGLRIDDDDCDAYEIISEIGLYRTEERLPYLSFFYEQRRFYRDDPINPDSLMRAVNRFNLGFEEHKAMITEQVQRLIRIYDEMKESK